MYRQLVDLDRQFVDIYSQLIDTYHHPVENYRKIGDISPQLVIVETYIHLAVVQTYSQLVKILANTAKSVAN